MLGSIRRDLDRFRAKGESGRIDLAYQAGVASTGKATSRLLAEFKPSGASVDAVAFLKAFLEIVAKYKTGGTTTIKVENGRISGIHIRLKNPALEALRASNLMLRELPAPQPTLVRGAGGTRTEEPHVVDAGTVFIEETFMTEGSHRESDRMIAGKIPPPSIIGERPPILPDEAVFEP